MACISTALSELESRVLGAVPRRALLRGGRPAARLRLQDRRQRAAAGQAQGRPSPGGAGGSGCRPGPFAAAAGRPRPRLLLRLLRGGSAIGSGAGETPLGRGASGGRSLSGRLGASTRERLARPVYVSKPRWAASRVRRREDRDRCRVEAAGRGRSWKARRCGRDVALFRTAREVPDSEAWRWDRDFQDVPRARLLPDRPQPRLKAVQLERPEAPELPVLRAVEVREPVLSSPPASHRSATSTVCSRSWVT